MATKQQKNKQEAEVARVCVCGRTPCTVKHKSKFMISCTAPMECAMRGQWKANEQEAIKNWNTAIQSARHESKT